MRAVLRQKHWQKYATFCAQYDKAAEQIDSDLVGGYPSRAQLHRWLGGTLRSLPYPDHCRVLERMLPGWTAEELFSPCPDGHVPQPRHSVAPAEPSPLPVNGVATGLASPNILPVGLRPHIEQAFTAEHVMIDFFGFSGETLHGVIQESLDRVRAGQLQPTSIRIRILVPDTAQPMVIPCRRDGLADDPDLRARAAGIMTRHARAILDSVAELITLGRAPQASAQIRQHRAAPLFKLYLLNDTEAFYGFYPIVEQSLPFPDGNRDMYDLMGKDALLFHHSTHDRHGSGAAYVSQARAWFESVWNTISYEYQP